jgi:hypothetical protein
MDVGQRERIDRTSMRRYPVPQFSVAIKSIGRY